MATGHHENSWWAYIFVRRRIIPVSVDSTASGSMPVSYKLEISILEFGALNGLEDYGASAFQSLIERAVLGNLLTSILLDSAKF
jgi:hypothetical protein